jgi:hypothetical protein
MVCRFCGQEVPATARICNHCGKDLRNVPRGLDFSAYISEEIRNFTGRTWVFQAINDWLGKPDGSRFFLLTGEPGCGKSAIAARLAQFAQGEAAPPAGLPNITPGFLNAIHFCLERASTWIDPRDFARSISLQLTYLPEFAQALVNVGDREINMQVHQEVQTLNGQMIGINITNLNLSGLKGQEAFNRAVLEPLQIIYGGTFNQPLTILVDALDESLAPTGEVTIVGLLSRLQHLPAQVRFILTSRPESRVETEFRDAEGLFLSGQEFSDHNRQDISDYVHWRLTHEEKLQEKLLGLSPDQAAAKEKIINLKAEGNFQYVTFLLDALAKEQQSWEDLDALPAGLDGLYHDSLQRVVRLGGKQWEDYAKFLAVLSVAKESLTLAHVQAFIGQDERTAWALLGDLWQFVKPTQRVEGQEEDYYRLYHQSVIDFLRRPQLQVKGKRLPNSYFLPAMSGHEQIVSYYQHLPGTWLTEEFPQDRPEAYLCRHLAYHLAEAKKQEELEELLLNCRWLRSKLAATGIHALIRDYDYLRENPDLRLIQRALQLSGHVLARDADQLAGQLPGRLMSIESPKIQNFLEQLRLLQTCLWLRPLSPTLTPPGGFLLATLRGHGGGVQAVALTPDGRRAVSGSDDKTLKVWDLESWVVLQTLRGHEGSVKAVALTPDGRRAVSGSADMTLKVWNLESGTELHTLRGHEHKVTMVALSPDGRRAVSGSPDKTLKVWDLEQGKCLTTFTGDSMMTCAVSPDGTIIVAGDFSGMVHFLRLEGEQVSHQ